MFEKVIVLCTKCEGSGKIVHCKLIDYHRYDYYHWNEECSTCKGYGRLYKVTTIKYEILTNV